NIRSGHPTCPAQKGGFNFWDFFPPQHLGEIPMVINFGNSDRAIDLEHKPLQFYLVGTREEVQATINQLHVLRFSDRIRWSVPVPVSGSNWQYVSIMQRDRAAE
ncbi:hypothetical protein ACN4EG_26155, partial [Alkalinema pantanalense CENA528]|uniref:hypothetical protein n=1 Tax=Alkalinema pantanalense TaxID=1620705 RepID=UPI003D700469